MNLSLSVYVCVCVYVCVFVCMYYICQCVHMLVDIGELPPGPSLRHHLNFCKEKLEKQMRSSGSSLLSVPIGLLQTRTQVRFYLNVCTCQIQSKTFLSKCRYLEPCVTINIPSIHLLTRFIISIYSNEMRL